MFHNNYLVDSLYQFRKLGVMWRQPYNLVILSRCNVRTMPQGQKFEGKIFRHLSHTCFLEVNFRKHIFLTINIRRLKTGPANFKLVFHQAVVILHRQLQFCMEPCRRLWVGIPPTFQPGLSREEQSLSLNRVARVRLISIDQLRARTRGTNCSLSR